MIEPVRPPGGGDWMRQVTEPVFRKLKITEVRAGLRREFGSRAAAIEQALISQGLVRVEGDLLAPVDNMSDFLDATRRVVNLSGISVDQLAKACPFLAHQRPGQD